MNKMVEINDSSIFLLRFFFYIQLNSPGSTLQYIQLNSVQWISLSKELNMPHSFSGRFSQTLKAIFRFQPVQN